MAGYLDKDAIIESLTIKDVIAILTDLGSVPPIDYGDSGLAFQTVCHGGTNTKLYYYHEGTDIYPAKLFHCYTKCGESFGIIELVIRAKRAQGKTITFYQALRYIANITDNMFYSKGMREKKDTNITDDWEWINKFKKKNQRTKREIPQLSEISEHILELFYYAPHIEWLNDGISRNSIIKYEISYYGLTNKIIIPHRDLDGRLIGIRGRALCEREIEEGYKYMPITIEGETLSHKLGLNLYGLYHCQEAIKRMGKIMLVEGEKSALLGDTFYGANNFVVATCGSSLTDTQCQIIRSLGVREVFIAYDKEYENHESRKAEVYYNKLLKLAHKLTPYVTVYLVMDRQNLLKKQESPLDRGKKVLEKLMKDKILITTKESSKKE